MTKSAAPAVAARLEDFLRAHSFLEPNEVPTCTPLLGGVSSDIWRVSTSSATLCVKRALPELKVASDWRAPVNRNANEWAWLCFAFEHQPRAVPTPLAHDPEAGLFAMSYLPPEDYPVWKQRLLHGQIDARTAVQVGTLVAALHNASAGDSDLAGQFDSLEIFSALRLDPYFAATGTRHPALAARLQAISDRTACTRRALVHGDISPKNILVGAAGPVFLDAECACYGDPAFDLAFCLTHLLLKSLVHAHHLGAYLNCFDALTTSYLDDIQFEPRADLEARSASLLPALLLARIDGKSPVEYLIGQDDKQQWVREFAFPLLLSNPSRLLEIAKQWRRKFAITPPRGRDV